MENELEKKDCPLSHEDRLMEPAPVSCPAPEDELSLLRSIRAELVEQNASSGRKIRLLRGCLIAVSLIALVAVVAAATLLPSLYHMVDNINVTVNALDMQRVDEILGDGVVDVGLKQRHANLAHALLDALLRQLALAAQLAQCALQLLCQALKGHCFPPDRAG